MIPRTRAAAARPAIMCILIACLATPAVAQITPYELSPGAEFRTGCFTTPCVCGPLQDAVTGAFSLVRQASDPQFAHYDVIGVDWVAQFPTGFVRISGSGSYRVGGTASIQQQLTLDLSVGGAPVRHFDSGLIPGGGNFPRLDATVSLYGLIACIDTALIVRGGPSTASVVGGAVTLEALAPNPFRAATRVGFSLPEAGPARVTVHDVAGRCLRTLVDGDRLEAGPHTIAWDGRSADGRSCAAGCYFVRIAADGRTEQRSVVKLR